MGLSITDQLTRFKRYNLYVIQSNEKSLLDFIQAIETEGITVIDIGKSLSALLMMLTSTRYLSLDTEEHLKQIIEENAKQVDKGKPPIAAIFNLGILLEPVISIDAAKIIKEVSKTIAIIMIWDGQIDSDDVLHWEEQKSAYQLNFTDTHLKLLNIPYEV